MTKELLTEANILMMKIEAIKKGVDAMSSASNYYLTGTEVRFLHNKEVGGTSVDIPSFLIPEFFDCVYSFLEGKLRIAQEKFDSLGNGVDQNLRTQVNK